MWQRVQTLYLFVATALSVALFFCSKAGEVSYISSIPYLVLMVVVSILDVLALTSYKFRVFQMRTAILSALITLAFQLWLAVDYFTAPKEQVFSFTAIFPLLSVILLVLAARSIFADELMVRSSSRLRSAKRKTDKPQTL